MSLIKTIEEKKRFFGTKRTLVYNGKVVHIQSKRDPHFADYNVHIILNNEGNLRQFVFPKLSYKQANDLLKDKTITITKGDDNPFCFAEQVKVLKDK